MSFDVTPFQKSYVNLEVEITMRKIKFGNPDKPWEEPIPRDYIFVLWKDTKQIEKIEVRDFIIINDGGTEIYQIKGKELVVPQSKFPQYQEYKLTYDKKPLGTALASKALENFINQVYSI